MRINWRRGALRLWMVVSDLWSALIAIVLSEQLNIAWPFATPQVVHVKISDTETWDYPAEWGVARIEADLKKRVEELDRKDREWLAGVPEARKAECRAGTTDPVISDINRALKGEQAPFREDCERMFWVM